MSTAKSNTNTKPIVLINTKGASSLIEYTDGDLRRRVYIPKDELKDGRVSEVIISRAIPYGFPWDEIQLTVSGSQLAEALHRQDLWTVEDVLKSPQKLRLALQATINSQLSEVLTIAHGEKKGVNNNGTG